MSEQEIFQHLFSISSRSDDVRGVVASCFVRDGKILVDAVSNNEGIHSEYALLLEMKKINISVQPGDIVYTTVEPCGKRTPGGIGERYGDCTTNLIESGVKHIVYAAGDPDASNSTRHKFSDAGVILEQIPDKDTVNLAVQLFNSTHLDPGGYLPNQ